MGPRGPQGNGGAIGWGPQGYQGVSGYTGSGPAGNGFYGSFTDDNGVGYIVSNGFIQ